MHSLLDRLLGLLFVAIAALLLASPAHAAGQAAENAALFDAASWMLLAGVLTPLITSVVQQPRWTGAVRVVVGVVASLIIGVLTLLANGALNEGPQTVLSLLALVVVTSAAAYKTLWVPSGVAPKIENATSKNPPYAPDPGPVPGGVAVEGQDEHPKEGGPSSRAPR